MVGSPRVERATPSKERAATEVEITACESRPGKVVFLESGNTDGWIASDHVVDLPR